MANASARNIAPAPILRSGSPSNLRVRCSRRTAESRYLPRLRLAPAGRSPAATKARRTAPGIPLLSVGMPPVLLSSTSSLLPVILTHTLPLCSEINRRGCAREPSERCDAYRIILPGFSVLRPRAQISERKRGADRLPVRLRRLPRRPAARIGQVIEPAFEPEGPEGGYDLGRGVTEGQVVFVEQRTDGELAG